METYYQSEKIANKQRELDRSLPDCLDLSPNLRLPLNPVYVRDFILMDLLVMSGDHHTDAIQNLKV